MCCCWLIKCPCILTLSPWATQGNVILHPSAKRTGEWAGEEGKKEKKPNIHKNWTG